MKKYEKFLLVVIVFIILIFLSDFIFLMIKRKPLILISKNDQKYSSIFYDVYDCNNEKVIKNKFSKFNCQVTPSDNDKDNNNKENNKDNNQDVIDNTQNNNQDNKNDNNQNSNKDNKQDDIIDNNKDKDNNNNNNNNNNNDDNSKDDNKQNTNKDNNNSNDNNDNKNNNIKDNPIIDGTIKDTIIGNNKITIIDRSSGNCPQAIEYYYEDSEYKYYFTCIISGSIFVKVDGVEYNIKTALNNKIVTMNDLIEAGFKPLKKSKNLSAY